MGNKLDTLLGRTFKASKFEHIVTEAFLRLAAFKKQRQTWGSQDWSKVVQLLQRCKHDRALHHVKHVIRQQNLFDVDVMIEGYFNLVIVRLNLIEQERKCPNELKEAILGLIHAASKIREFPELKDISNIFTTHYGKEFAARASGLSRNSGVNPEMLAKLSEGQPSLESRMKVLKEIASKNNIVLQLEEAGSISTEENLDVNKRENQPEPSPSANSGSNNLQILHEEIGKDDWFPDSMKVRRKYRNAAQAAQAAVEFSACAGEAARAAVELSLSEPHDPDDQGRPSTGQGKVLNRHGTTKTESESVNEEMHISKEIVISSDDVIGQGDPFVKKLHLDESDYENENEQSSILSHKQIPSWFQAGPKVESNLGNPVGHAAEGSGAHGENRINFTQRPMSVRPDLVRRYREGTL